MGPYILEQKRTWEVTAPNHTRASGSRRQVRASRALPGGTCWKSIQMRTVSSEQKGTFRNPEGRRAFEDSARAWSAHSHWMTCQGRRWDAALPCLTRAPQGRRERCLHICGSFSFKPLKILEFKLKRKGSLAANLRSLLLIHFI